MTRRLELVSKDSFTRAKDRLKNLREGMSICEFKNGMGAQEEISGYFEMEGWLEGLSGGIIGNQQRFCGKHIISSAFNRIGEHVFGYVDNYIVIQKVAVRIVESRFLGWNAAGGWQPLTNPQSPKIISVLPINDKELTNEYLEEEKVREFLDNPSPSLWNEERFYKMKKRMEENITKGMSERQMVKALNGIWITRDGKTYHLVMSGYLNIDENGCVGYETREGILHKWTFGYLDNTSLGIKKYPQLAIIILNDQVNEITLLS